MHQWTSRSNVFIGSTQGNCCGSESQEVENHQIKPIKNTTKSKAKGAGQTLGGASASPSNVDSEGSREAMLSAAEKRRVQVRSIVWRGGGAIVYLLVLNQAENRGVKEGGKLSKQLADEKKQKNQPLSPRDEADDRLVVSNVRVCVFAMVIDTNGRF